MSRIKYLFGTVSSEDKTINQINVLVPVFGTQPVIHIQDVVIIFIIVTLIMSRFTGFRQHPSWIMCGLITELGIADVIRFENVSSQLSQRL